MSSGIEPLIPAYIARQRWFGGTEVDDVRVVDREVLRDDFPKLVWMLCDVDGDHYQLVFGGRPMGGIVAPDVWWERIPGQFLAEQMHRTSSRDTSPLA